MLFLNVYNCVYKTLFANPVRYITICMHVRKTQVTALFLLVVVIISLLAS